MRRAKPVERLDQVEVWKSFVDSWKRLQRAGEKNLAGAEMSTADLRILRVLRDQGSSPMNRFASETMLSPPTITGVVDKLEERGLVERVRNPEDRREILIAITQKGTITLTMGEELHKRFLDRSLSVLSDAELRQLASLMKKLADSSGNP